MKSVFMTRIAVFAAAIASATIAFAADPFPTKPIKIIVNSAAGGLVDKHARLVAKGLSEKFGQAVVVENQAGAGGLIGIRGVKAAPADGYTLLASVNTIAIQQAASLDPGYEIEKDFVGIAGVSRSPFIVVTAPSEPDKSIADLIARAKANPGKITYASAGVGSTTHLVAAMFANMAGIDLAHVPYRGNSSAWSDLMAGRVGILFEGFGSGASMIRDGRLKGLGVTSNKPFDALREVRPIAEQGVPGFNFSVWVGIIAPAGTPKDVVQKLNATVNEVLAAPDLLAQFQAEGSDVMAMSSEEFNSFLKGEAAAMSKLITAIGLPKS